MCLLSKSLTSAAISPAGFSWVVVVCVLASALDSVFGAVVVFGASCAGAQATIKTKKEIIHNVNQPLS